MRFSLGEPPVVRLQPRTGLDAGLSVATRLSIIIVGFAVFFAVLDVAQVILAPVFLAVITGLMMTPLAKRLEKVMPVALSSGFVGLVFLCVLTGALCLFSLPFSVWMERRPVIWHDLQRHMADWRQMLDSVSAVREEVRAAAGQGGSMRVEIDDGSAVTDIAAIAPELIAQLILFLGSLYFFLAERERIRTGILTLCFSRRLRLRVAHVFRDAEWFVSRYLLSITVINLALGLATAAAMAALNVPQPLLWGMLAFGLNFIIYIGPAIMTVILFGVGLTIHDSAPAIFIPAAAYLALNLVEAQFVTPHVIGRFLTLNPFFVVVSLSLWIWLWGPAGGFVAVPSMLLAYAVMRNLIPLAKPGGTSTEAGKTGGRAEPMSHAARF